MDEFGESDYPEYGQVNEIIVWKDDKFLVVTVLATVSFCSQYMGYEVQPTMQQIVILPKKLQWHGVLHFIRKQDRLFIVEKNSARIEDIE